MSLKPLISQPLPGPSNRLAEIFSTWSPQLAGSSPQVPNSGFRSLVLAGVPVLTGAAGASEETAGGGVGAVLSATVDEEDAGALLPLLVGKVADASDYATALAVPLLCYVILFLFALGAARARVHAAGIDAEDEAMAETMV